MSYKQPHPLSIKYVVLCLWKDTTQAQMQAQQYLYQFATQPFTRKLCQLLSSLWTSSNWSGRFQGEGILGR